MLALRIATAVIGIPLIVLAISGGEGLPAAGVALAVAMAASEIAAARNATYEPLSLLSAVLGASMPIAAYAGGDWLMASVLAAIMLPSAAFTLARAPAAD